MTGWEGHKSEFREADLAPFSVKWSGHKGKSADETEAPPARCEGTHKSVLEVNKWLCQELIIRCGLGHKSNVYGTEGGEELTTVLTDPLRKFAQGSRDIGWKLELKEVGWEEYVDLLVSLFVLK